MPRVAILLVYIGNDDAEDGMRNTAMIFKNVNVGGKQLSIGVIGPKRMNYSKVIKMLNNLTDGIDRMFGANLMLPSGDDDSDF